MKTQPGYNIMQKYRTVPCMNINKTGYVYKQNT